MLVDPLDLRPSVVMSLPLATSIAVTLLRNRPDARSIRIDIEDECWTEVGRSNDLPGKCYKVRFTQAEVASRSDIGLYSLALSRLPDA